LLRGARELAIGGRSQRLESGTVIHLTREMTTSWKNVGETTAVLLWVKI